MKLKDLIPKLQALNPEAEVYVYFNDEGDGAGKLEAITGGKRHEGSIYSYVCGSCEDATPSDTLIVLSE